MSLYELSRSILLLNQAPINKIRLARMVYFTHKDLIRKKFMQPDEIAYIRSPLGPIPDGFMSLAHDHPGIISRRNSQNLSFANEDYTLPSPDIDAETTALEQYRDVLTAIERVLKALKDVPTPELIRASHHDPSWLTHHNGDIYYITAADLKNTFPFSALPTAIRIKIRFSHSPSSQKNEIGALQANLLRGMISDIVKESTDLEYPDEYISGKPPKKKKGI